MRNTHVIWKITNRMNKEKAKTLTCFPKLTILLAIESGCLAVGVDILPDASMVQPALRSDT